MTTGAETWYSQKATRENLTEEDRSGTLRLKKITGS